MKPGSDDRASLGLVASFIDIRLSSWQLDLFDRYATWLGSEAVSRSGIGPDEADRIYSRHISDSLAFAAGFSVEPPSSLVDVGSGAGLPGIPLAILWPHTRVLLWDRSRRKVDLLNRACRVLGLRNAEVWLVDAGSTSARIENGVMRAVIGPRNLHQVAEFMAPGGRLVVGTTAGMIGKASVPPGWNSESIEIPQGILDHPAALLVVTVP